MKKIIKSKNILNNINLVTDLAENDIGNTYTYLKKLLKKGTFLLDDSIILFDADVDISDITTKSVPYLKFYDKDGYPIEKRIVKWIYDLDGSHVFFKNVSKEKASFIADFSSVHLTFLDDDTKIKHWDIKPFKKWAENNTVLFKKCITQYVAFENESFKNFRTEIIDAINLKRREKSLKDL